jgi:hypothetical protein
MAVAGSAFNWVRVSGGVWTRISQGPLVSGLPLQALELATLGAPSAVISFTLDGYSASPPFYERDTNVVTTGFAGSPPVGSTGIWAVVLSYRLSPYVEFWLLANTPCFAHIAMF